MSEPVAEIVDGDVVHGEPEAEPEVAPQQSMALAVVDAASGAIIRADQPEEILTKATAIANALKGLIDGQGLAVSMGGKRKHVEVSAWQACGALLGALGGQALHAESVWTRRVSDGAGGFHRTTYTASVDHFKWVDGRKQLASTTTYEVDGFDWEACVEIRTGSGFVVGRAEAMVSRTEEKWSRRDDYAVRSMAETRAESRAWRKAAGWIVAIAGYNPTPAEEMPGAEPAGPPYGPELPQEHRQRVGQALCSLLEIPGEPLPDVQPLVKQLIDDAGGYLPAIVGKALLRVDKALMERMENRS